LSLWSCSYTKYSDVVISLESLDLGWNTLSYTTSRKSLLSLLHFHVTAVLYSALIEPPPIFE
jgi:hypothetical protein